jgi:hypothetical protein
MSLPEKGDEAIVEMVIIGIPVHEHDRRTVAGSFPHMDAVWPSRHEAILDACRFGC